MWKSERQGLIICVLMSLAIYYLGTSCFASNVQFEFRQPTSPVTYTESLILGNDNYPISLPVAQLDRGNTTFRLNSGVRSSRGILNNINRYTWIGSCSHEDNTCLNRLGEAETSSTIIGSLNTIFKLINGQDCQHLALSPPDVSF